MPVPKTLAAKTEAPIEPVVPVEPAAEPEELPEFVSDVERFAYERRREALGFAVQVRAAEPVEMARDMLAFLEGDQKPEVTV